MGGVFLIASNNAETVGAVKKALGGNDSQVLSARDGLEALDLALDRAPNAVFLSLDLPKVDGVEVARALRALDPTEFIPIIFIADNDTEAKQIAEEEVPFTECLTAPLNLAEVRRRAAEALRNAQRLTELRQRVTNPALYALYDPLTRVHQRRYTVNRLAYEAARSVRYKHPLSVLLVDMDNLQSINREHGVVIGDSVLVETAQLMYRAIRRTDLIGRYDIQDFIVILPETTAEGAADLADRFRKMLAQYKFLGGKLGIKVTVSVGVAGAAGDDLAENLALIGRAATALDRAKRAGKNRVEKG